MPSRADMRVWGERGLRALSLLVLAVMLWRSLHFTPETSAASVGGTASASELRAWSTANVAPARIAVALDSMPGRMVRDWLSALKRSGSRVTWTGDLPPIAIAAGSLASPAGGTVVLVSAPNRAEIELRDDVGPFDTVRAESGGAHFLVQAADGPFIASTSNARATAPRRDSVILRRVLLLGSAGWEGKFVTAALEEAGWKVDAMLHVAPGVDVSQNAGRSVDTARYAAVVALDESAVPWSSAIERYARSGGGAILGPGAAGEAFSRLRAGVSAPTETPATAGHEGPVTLAMTELSPLKPLREDAVVLERRGNDVAVAARRYFAGRVVQIGYPETWRWRMAGDDLASQAHRNWWSGIVSAVAYAPRMPVAEAAGVTDDAPLAALVSALGPATRTGAVARTPGVESHWTLWLAILLSISLLAELTSRRLRGAR